jgi:ATP-binding cassette subfamily B protein
MIGGFLFLICANITALFLPYLISLAIDNLQAGANSSLLVRYAILIVVAGAVQAILAFFGRYFQAKVSRQIEYELRTDLFKHFELLELDYFQHHKVGDLVARATNDLTAIRSMLGPGISNLMNTIVAFTVTITFMLTIDIQLTLYAAIILPLITI